MNDKDRLIEEQRKLIEAQQKTIDALTKQLLLGNRPMTYPVPYPDPGPFVYKTYDKNTADATGYRYYNEHGDMISDRCINVDVL